MRIGLSIITGAKHNVWNNGIGQNIYFLATLLEGLPFVADVVLINTGDEPNPPGDAGLLGQRYALVEADEALDRVDVAIEISGALGMEWLREFRARRAGSLPQLRPALFRAGGTLGVRPVGLSGRHGPLRRAVAAAQGPRLRPDDAHALSQPGA
jgi:hypothetical protein